MKKTLFVLLMLVFGNAQASTVHDPVNFIVNLLNKMENQISKVQQAAANNELFIQAKRQLETIETLRRQLLVMQNQVDSLRGSNGYGRYLEGPFKALDPRYTPQSLTQLLWLMRDVGNTSSGPVNEQLQEFLANNPYYQGSYKPSYQDDILETDREGIRDNSAATAVYSQETYETAQKSYDNINALQKEIDSAETLKDSVDLNNRIMTELSYMIAVSMRNDSVSNNLEAKKAQKEVNAETRARDFNQYRPKRYEVVK